MCTNVSFFFQEDFKNLYYLEIITGRGGGTGEEEEGGGGVRLCGRVVGRQNRGRGGGYIHVPGEIRASVVDHVLNHGLVMAEAGQRLQSNVGRTSVSSIIATFR